MKTEAQLVAHLEWLVDAVEKLEVPANQADMNKEQLVQGTVLFAQVAIVAWMLDMEESIRPILLAGRLGAAVLKLEEGHAS